MSDLGKLHFAVYVSKATISFTKTTLKQLVQTSQVNNQKKGISGYLYLEDDYFLQYIESYNLKELEILIDKLKSDKRHAVIQTFIASANRDKRFFDWQMGLLNKQQLIDVNLEKDIIDYIKWLSSDPDIAKYDGSRIWGLIDTLASQKMQIESLWEKI